MASFSVVSNITSNYAQTNLQTTQLGLQKALSRLSSGFRINQSGDDAAGLAVANGYRNTSATLTQGIRNANDGMSKLNIKDGALSNISNLLDRLATLAAQAASVSAGVAGEKLNTEFKSVVAEISREATVAGLNSADNFSVFVSAGTSGTVGGTIAAASTSTLQIGTLTVDTAVNAAAAVTAIGTAVGLLGTAQSNVGALQNSLQFAISLAQSQLVNTRGAESRIRDANVAEEAANMTRYNILSQSGIAALSQANQSTSSVLALLR